jgi:hypothetical protein
MKPTLKKISSFMMALAISGTLFAQVPQKFNYQGIARDTKGNPLANQAMSLKLSILPTADALNPEYEEMQLVNTNEYGLYTLQIGNGNPIYGEMKAVKWETGNKYIKVAIDPMGGSDFKEAGTNQLLSVPYAIYADKAGVAVNGGGDKTRTGTVSTSATGTGTINYLTKFTAANTIYNSQVFDNGTNIGIGTTTPIAKFQINQNIAGVQEHLRMQNTNTLGAGRFTLYNDVTASYATFTKYGTTYTGGYVGISSKYPYANLLAFGNNGGDGNGRFLVSSAGNIGISLSKGGTSKLKFHADFATENVSIGGNADPVNRVHLNNSDGTDMTVGITNNTSGHTAADGLIIRENGSLASINNKENGALTLGTNNTDRISITSSGRVGINTPNPNARLHVIGSEDTIAFFQSASNNYTGDGIVRAEYAGTDLNDHVAIYGKSIPDSLQFSGIGIRGDGGYLGGIFYGVNKDVNSSYGIIATALGKSNHYGVFGYATSIDASPANGERVGLIGLAEGGNINAGLNANAYSTAGNSAYGVYAAASGGGTNLAGLFDGNVNVLGNLSKGGGTFKIDHPQDPANKYLIHSFVESPDMMNIYNGNTVTNNNGEAEIILPAYFEAENKDFRYQLTVIGKDARVFVKQEIQNNTFAIKSSEPNTKVSWQVTGVRNDAWANANRVIPEVEKKENEKGKYLYPILEGKSTELGIYNYNKNHQMNTTQLSNPSDLKPTLKK